MRKTGIMLLVIGTALFIFLAVSSYFNGMNLVDVPARGTRIINRITLLERIRDPINNSIIAVRGYLLTGDETYLEPYYKAVPVVRDNINEIRRVHIARPVLHERLNKLESLVNERFGVLEQAIELRKRGAYSPRVRKADAAKGAELDREINSIINGWVSEDLALSEQLGLELSASLRDLIRTALLGVALSIFLLVLILLLNRMRNRALVDSESWLRGITATALDAVIAIDNDGKVTLWNDSATKIFGYTNEDVMGKYLHSLIMPESHINAFTRGFEAFRMTGEGRFIGKAYEIEGKRKDETEFPVELSLAALKLKDKWNAIGIVRDITERKRMEDEIKHMAHHDALTGLPNRWFFMDMVRLEAAQARRNRKKLALLYLDLDRFKEVNDTLGHEAGDELLRQVALRLKATVRESDTVARIGGDEFNILLSDLSRAEDSADIARKIVECFQELFAVAGHDLHITTSIGAGIYPDDSEDIDSVFRFADIAMYHAKEMGRNVYQFYNVDMNIRSIERIKMESNLKQTLERGELMVFYQPEVDMKTGRIVEVEALVRWRHPELGLLEPKQFLSVAEDTGFIVSIDKWVLMTACSQVKAWLDAGLDSLGLAVNVSSRNFQYPELVPQISEILKETGLPAEYLDVEITETIAMTNIERTISRMNELTELGVHVSIDDFGTGYSSLNYLKRLPIQKLKIDRPFIKDIATEVDDKAIISAITAMAHSMKIKVLAEGVETEEQIEFLRSMDCDEMQGFVFSEPLSSEGFERFMKSNGHH